MHQERRGAYRAHTNIALIKYWGKRNEELFLPMTSSLSLTLEDFYTDTAVVFDSDLEADEFYLNGQAQRGESLQRVVNFLDLFRQPSGVEDRARVVSLNHVPTAAGLASSASAFAALACATHQALDMSLSPRELSTYARQGSGSATRSLFGDFVLWHQGQGEDSSSSYAEPFHQADFDIGMLIVLVNQEEKSLSSRQGMELTRKTSPFYQIWPEIVAEDLTAMKSAIRQEDLAAIGRVAERNAMRMHATMLGSDPSFTYFEPRTLVALNHVRALRQAGIEAYATLDAGPNVKVICRQADLDQIRQAFLADFSEDQLIFTRPGPGPKALDFDQVMAHGYH